MKLKVALVSLIFTLLSTLSYADVCQEWNELDQKIRDGKIEKYKAKILIIELNEKIQKHYNNKIQSICWFNFSGTQFPVNGYGINNVGGVNGNGYKPEDYDFYDGNKHGGHPAHDIFVDDKNQDSLDDETGKEIEIVSYRSGIVIAVNYTWDPESEIRGGKYVWVFSNNEGGESNYYYYAHLEQVKVSVGDILIEGQLIGYLGRTGFNAYPKRAPTHLHFMSLNFEDGNMIPYNSFQELNISNKTLNINYRWLSKNYTNMYNIKNIVVSQSFKRVKLNEDSFGHWLRNLPLKEKGTKVFLYNNKKKNNQKIHYAVIDIDVGDRDLQQCADAVMRLRAEYLYSRGEYNKIHFKFLNGFNFKYSKWKAGYNLNSKKNAWLQTPGAQRPGYKNFRKYMNIVFNYANTKSLNSELKSVPIKDIQPGDVFIQGIKTHYNHAVIVLDVAINEKGEKIFLIAQSFTPAQDIEVLIKPGSKTPWHPIPEANEFETAEWLFYKSDLKRF